MFAVPLRLPPPSSLYSTAAVVSHLPPSSSAPPPHPVDDVSHHVTLLQALVRPLRFGALPVWLIVVFCPPYRTCLVVPTRERRYFPIPQPIIPCWATSIMSSSSPSFECHHSRVLLLLQRRPTPPWTTRPHPPLHHHLRYPDDFSGKHNTLTKHNFYYGTNQSLVVSFGDRA